MKSLAIGTIQFYQFCQQNNKLFIDSSKGKQTHIAKTELQNFISTHRKFAQAEGMRKPITFHGLRHTCAAEWYQKLIADGKSEFEARLQVSKWLGHERDDVTRIYLAGIGNGGDAYV